MRRFVIFTGDSGFKRRAHVEACAAPTPCTFVVQRRHRPLRGTQLTPNDVVFVHYGTLGHCAVDEIRAHARKAGATVISTRSLLEDVRRAATERVTC